MREGQIWSLGSGISRVCPEVQADLADLEGPVDQEETGTEDLAITVSRYRLLCFHACCLNSKVAFLSFEFSFEKSFEFGQLNI